MKVKLSKYDLGVVINALNNYQQLFENESCFCEFILRLVDLYEEMKSERNKKIVFQPVEIQYIRSCLIAWRNDSIRAEKNVAVGAISETLAKFI